jgi:TM2 domain-containing membrane protein YozV
MFLILLLIASAASANNCTYELCSYHGTCSVEENNTCICDKGWITNPSINDKQCNSIFDLLLIISDRKNNAPKLAGSCTETMCNNHGYCNNDNTTCICNSGYTTYKSKDGSQCNYKQKDSVTAFCLTFFLMFVGAGNWYLGNTVMAVGQLVYSIGGKFIIYFIVNSLKELNYLSNEIAKKYRKMLVNFLGIGYLIWWIIELVAIGQGNMTDGNGAPVPGL